MTVVPGEACPECKNVNVVHEEDFSWCRNCGWTSDGGEVPTPGLKNKGR